MVGVVSIGSADASGIGARRQQAAAVVTEREAPAVGVGFADKPIVQVVSEIGDVALGIGEQSLVAIAVVTKPGCAALRVKNAGEAFEGVMVEVCRASASVSRIRLLESMPRAMAEYQRSVDTHEFLPGLGIFEVPYA